MWPQLPSSKKRKTTLPPPDLQVMLRDPRRRKRYLWAAGIVVLLAGMIAAVYYAVERRAREGELYRTADSYWQQGQYAEAARYYERLLSRYPRGKLRQRVLLEAANTYYYCLRNVHRAIELYRALLADSPGEKDRLSARRSLGEIYLREVGDLTQAIEEYKALREEERSDKERQETTFILAEIYFKRNDLSPALDEFRKAAESPGDPHLQDKANLKIGNICQLQRNQRAAVAPFEKVVDHTQCAECRHQAQIGLVDAYEAQERFDAAIRILNTMQGATELEFFKAREIKRIEEKRSVLHAESEVNWSDKRAQRPKAKE